MVKQGFNLIINYKEYFIFLYLISLLFQFEIFPDGMFPFASRLYYFLTPLGLLILLPSKIIYRNLNISDFYIYFVLIYSLITLISNGVNTPILMAIASFCAYKIGEFSTRSTNIRGFYRLVNYAFIFVIFFYLFRFFYNVKEYFLIFDYGRYAVQSKIDSPSDFLFIMSGGWNAEISLLGIFSTLILGSRIYRIFLIFFIFHVLIFESRVGFLILLIHFLHYFKFNFKILIKTFFFLFLFYLIFNSFIDIEDILMRRFNLDSEYEILEEGHGRLFLWLEALELLKESLFGYGVGIGIIIANNQSFFEIPEPNFHNIYLQIFVDLGIFGFVMLLGLFIFFLNNYLKSKDKLSLGILIYFIVGFFQFTGYDIFIWYLIGIYVSLKIRNYVS